MNTNFGKTIRVVICNDDARAIESKLDMLPDYHIAKVFMSNCVIAHDERQQAYADELASEGKDRALLGTVSFPIFCANEVFKYLGSDDNVFDNAPDFIDEILSFS